MYVSYLPDEFHPVFEESLRLGAEWGLRHVEIRLVDGVNVLDLSDAQLDRARRLVKAHGMTVSAVATPFFKCLLPGQLRSAQGPLHGAQTRSYDDHVALLPRGVALAQAFETPYLRLFSFWRQEGADFWPALQAAVDAALAATEGSSVLPCLENEGACTIGTSAELAEAARRLTHPRLRFIWDPGNSARSGMVPRSADFALFGRRIALVHVKDGVYDAATGDSYGTLLGTGAVDYPTELQRLQAVDYAGALTLEPHYCPAGDCVAGGLSTLMALQAAAAEVGIDLH